MKICWSTIRALNLFLVLGFCSSELEAKNALACLAAVRETSLIPLDEESGGYKAAYVHPEFADRILVKFKNDPRDTPEPGQPRLSVFGTKEKTELMNEINASYKKLRDLGFRTPKLYGIRNQADPVTGQVEVYLDIEKIPVFLHQIIDIPFGTNPIDHWKKLGVSETDVAKIKSLLQTAQRIFKEQGQYPDDFAIRNIGFDPVTKELILVDVVHQDLLKGGAEIKGTDLVWENKVRSRYFLGELDPETYPREIKTLDHHPTRSILEHPLDPNKSLMRVRRNMNQADPRAQWDGFDYATSHFSTFENEGFHTPQIYGYRTFHNKMTGKTEMLLEIENVPLNLAQILRVPPNTDPKMHLQNLSMTKEDLEIIGKELERADKSFQGLWPDAYALKNLGYNPKTKRVYFLAVTDEGFTAAPVPTLSPTWNQRITGFW